MYRIFFLLKQIILIAFHQNNSFYFRLEIYLI